MEYRRSVEGVITRGYFILGGLRRLEGEPPLCLRLVRSDGNV